MSISVFNAVLQMCMFDLQPALLKFLKLPPGTSSKNMISKSKHWNKVKMTLRSYLTDLTRVITIFVFIVLVIGKCNIISSLISMYFILHIILIFF